MSHFTSIGLLSTGGQYMEDGISHLSEGEGGGK